MKRHHNIHLARLAFLMIVFALAWGSRAPAQITTQQVLCPPARIPEGWIKVDVVGQCSGETSAASNVKVIWKAG